MTKQLSIFQEPEPEKKPAQEIRIDSTDSAAPCRDMRCPICGSRAILRSVREKDKMYCTSGLHSDSSYFTQEEAEKAAEGTTVPDEKIPF